jgi:DNA (cytosine-5)-methyltransferase 1
MKHIDLFSGIGGFALACEWAGIETIAFVEIDKFCQKVLRKHWSDVPIVKDVNNVEEIKSLVANAHDKREQQQEGVIKELRGWAIDRSQAVTANATSKSSASRAPIGTLGESEQEQSRGGNSQILLLTAGFPCQPFSAAGQRKGSADSRYLWPQTLAVIKAVKPDWVLLENVAGILSMVFPDSGIGVASQASFCEVPNDEIADYDTISGRIDRDLRQAGYETVWLVVPACAVNAPHRRDRVWIVAHLQSRKSREPPEPEGREDSGRGDNEGGNVADSCEGGLEKAGTKLTTAGIARKDTRFATDSSNEGLQGRERSEPLRLPRQFDRGGAIPEWTENWYEVATRFCRVDDGIPNRVDRLKSLGNAIVPQVAYQIIKAIALISTTESASLNSDTKAQQGAMV